MFYRLKTNSSYLSSYQAKNAVWKSAKGLIESQKLIQTRRVAIKPKTAHLTILMYLKVVTHAIHIMKGKVNKSDSSNHLFFLSKEKEKFDCLLVLKWPHIWIKHMTGKFLITSLKDQQNLQLLKNHYLVHPIVLPMMIIK